MQGNIRPEMTVNGQACVRSAIRSALGLQGRWNVICRGKDGKVKWIDTIENLVTNAGEDMMLDVGLSAASATASWFVGLVDGTPTVAEGDTMGSHAGWAEITAYAEATREAWTDGGVSSQSVDNSASKASFAINGTTTVGGAFLTSVNTKSGTTGILYAVGAFSGGDRALSDGDTLEVTATFTAGGS